MSILKKKKRHKMVGDRTMSIISTIIIVVLLIVVAYPVLYVISCSFSSNAALNAGRVLLWPVDFTVDGYRFVFHYDSVMLGFRNSILYAIAGVSVTMILQILCAYPLSVSYYQGRKLFTVILLFDMLVGTGLIPSFLVKSKLGLVGSPLAVILTSAMSMGNVIILRTAFLSIPKDLFEAAEMDGANHFYSLVKIAIPLAKATLGVQLLSSFVGCWNEYFSAMIYLRDERLFPLPLVLREILTASQSLDLTSVSSAEMLAIASTGAEQIKYALILIATVPVLLMYAALSRCFKSGVMVGSIKG